MSDLISRQTVLDIIEREEFKGDAIAEIEKLPSADVSEVVHCKDCRFYRQGTLNFNGRCVFHGGFDPDEEWFCADGEKEVSE